LKEKTKKKDGPRKEESPTPLEKNTTSKGTRKNKKKKCQDSPSAEREEQVIGFWGKKNLKEKREESSKQGGTGIKGE